jgi:hypothetical protein
MVTVLRDPRPYGLYDWPENHCLLRLADNDHDPRLFFTLRTSWCLLLSHMEVYISSFRGKNVNLQILDRLPVFNVIFK